MRPMRAAWADSMSTPRACHCTVEANKPAQLTLLVVERKSTSCICNVFGDGLLLTGEPDPMAFPSLQRLSRYNGTVLWTKTVFVLLLLHNMLSGAYSVNITKYIAAEEVDWDYTAPTGINNCTGAPFIEPASLYTTDGLKNVYRKARFFEYTDASFSVR